MSVELNKPLPVSGYSMQPSENIDLVHEGKLVQERVLRYLDKLAALEFAGQKIDMRAVAVSRTHVDTAFMWAARSVFRPTRIALPEDDVNA